MVCALHPQSLPPPARPVHRTMVRVGPDDCVQPVVAQPETAFTSRNSLNPRSPPSRAMRMSLFTSANTVGRTK